jgi:hypothetical protein
MEAQDPNVYPVDLIVPAQALTVDYLALAFFLCCLVAAIGCVWRMQ